MQKAVRIIAAGMTKEVTFEPVNGAGEEASNRSLKFSNCQVQSLKKLDGGFSGQLKSSNVSLPLIS